MKVYIFRIKAIFNEPVFPKKHGSVYVKPFLVPIFLVLMTQDLMVWFVFWIPNHEKSGRRPVYEGPKTVPFYKKTVPTWSGLIISFPKIDPFHQRYLHRLVNSALIILKKVSLPSTGTRENASGVIQGAQTTGRRHGLVYVGAEDWRMRYELWPKCSFRICFRIPFLLFDMIWFPLSGKR